MSEEACLVACLLTVLLAMPDAGVVVDEVEVLPSDPPQRPTSVPQALQQNMPLASVSHCFSCPATHGPAMISRCMFATRAAVPHAVLSAKAAVLERARASPRLYMTC